MPDILVFSSPIGLGHATRDVAVFENLKDTSKRFVSGDAAARFILQNGLDVDDLYRPPAFLVEDGVLRKPLKWLLKYYSYYKQCKDLASAALDKYNPKLVVSDEDFASLVAAHKKGIKTVLITDILKTNFASGIGSILEKQMNKSMKKIIADCDLVILPEDGESGGNLARVGPIVRKTPYSRDQLRQKFSFHRKTITVSIGGTSLGKFLIEKTIQAYSKLSPDADLVVVSGPSLGIEDQNVRNLGFVNNLHEVIFASDLLVSLAGKSTMDEARHYGTPGIFIPIKGHFEQEENAAELGYTHDDIFHLDKLIQEKINEKRNPLPSDGAARTAELVRKFLS